MSKTLNRLSISLFAVLFIAFTASFIYADDAKKEMGLINKIPPRWWNVNPLSYPDSSDFMYHGEGLYTLNYVDGGRSKRNHTLNSRIVLRKNRITSDTTYVFKKTFTEKAKDTLVLTDGYSNPVKNEALAKGFYIHEAEVLVTDDEIHNLREDINIAITTRLSASIGLICASDNTKNIYKRFLYYAGPTYDLFQHDNFSLTVNASAFYVELEYTKIYTTFAQKLELLKIENDYEFGNIYDTGYLVNQKANWKALDYLTVNQNLLYLARSSTASKYLWDFSVGLDFQLSKNFSIVPMFRQEYHNEPQYMTRKTETTMDVGLKFSF